MRKILAALIFMFPASALGDSFSFETGECATDGCAQFESLLHSNANELADAVDKLSELHQYADPNEAGTTTGGIQEAVDRCGSGVSGNDPSNGCTVRLACGDVPISTQITVGGNSTATAKAGVRIIGCGSASVNSAAVTNPSIGGTTIVSSVADYGFKFQACSNCSIESVGYNGIDTSTGLLDIAESAASWPSSHIGVIDVDVERVTGYAVRSNAVSQVDQLTMLRSSFRDVGGCLQQNYSQNVLTMFLQSECGRLKSSGSKIGFDIVAGSFQFINSFFGTSSTVTGQTGFRLGTSASVVSIRDSHLELVTASNTLIDDNTGAASGHSFGSNTFDGNQVTVVGASNVCFDVATRGSWTVTNSQLQQTVACTSTFNMSNATDIANGDRLQFVTFNVVDNVGGDNIDNWAPTLGTGVVEQLVEVGDIGTTVQAYDADLADLADGSLSGALIGAPGGVGVDASVITSGTMSSTARLPSVVIEESELNTTTKINDLTVDDDFITASGTYDMAVTGSAAFTGTLRGGVSVTSVSGTTATLLSTTMIGDLYYCTNAAGCDVTLPSAAAGLNACFYDGNGGGVVVLDAAVGDKICLDGVCPVGTAEAIDSAGNIGDFVCILAVDSSNWVTLGRSGTWVTGGAD